MEVNNRLVWEKKVPIHIESAFYDVESFLSGKSTLGNYDINLIKPFENKRVLHLQCHFGLDTLSIKKSGAGEIVGVDFCESGLEYARDLSKKTSIDATFVNADVLTDLSHLSKFDIIYTSYGVLCWLSNLNKWATNIYNCLEKSGRFILTEFHPLSECFCEVDNSVIGNYEIESIEKIEEREGTYADRNASIKYTQQTWRHSLTSVLSALTNAGLYVTFFEERYSSPYKIFSTLIPSEHGGWRTPSPVKIPLIYSLICKKQ